MQSQLLSLNKVKDLTGTFVEVGTWMGWFAETVLANTQCAKLYCVDPYKKFSDEEYPDAINSSSQEDLDRVYEATRDRLTEKYGDRVEFLRMESKEAVKLFEDDNLDFVYIDGNHEYSAVNRDISDWFPKVKKGGYLCGDDVHSTDIVEHDIDGNVTRVWTKDAQGKPACWGKYGTYAACKANEEKFGIQFTFEETQFSVQK